MHQYAQDALGWRDRVRGRARVWVRNPQGEYVAQQEATNTITPLGLLWVFWGLAAGINPGSYSSTPNALTGTGAGSIALPNGGTVGPVGMGGVGGGWWDGTFWHAPFSPWTLLVLTTAGVAASGNVAPAGTLVGAYGHLQGNATDQPWQNPAVSGQTLNNANLTVTSVANPTVEAPSPTWQGPNVVQVVAEMAYNTTGTSLTVGSIGFTSGLYAVAGGAKSPTTWTGMTNATTNAPFLLTGAGTAAASTENLSIASWLVLNPAITIPNNNQVGISYDLQFVPAT